MVDFKTPILLTAGGAAEYPRAECRFASKSPSLEDRAFSVAVHSPAAPAGSIAVWGLTEAAPKMCAKVLEVTVEKVLCTDPSGSLALPALKDSSAFVKVELRGNENSKFSTHAVKLDKDTLTFDYKMKLDLTEDATELRFLLCKRSTTQQNTVVSAAGIYVKDIIRASPVIKYFDLFKSYGSGFGGAIKLKLEVLDAATTAAANGSTAAPGGADKAAKGGKGAFPGGVLTKLAIVAAVAFGVLKLKK